jgi:hypothetical protein
VLAVRRLTALAIDKCHLDHLAICMAVILVPVAAVVAAILASAFTVATATLRRRSSTAQQSNGTEVLI